MKTIGSNSVSEKRRGSSAQQVVPISGQVLEEGLDTDLIADLSNEQIQLMTEEEMLRVIKAAQIDFMDQDYIQRLTYLDRCVLERLVYLARFSCQNQRCRKRRLRY